MDTKRLIEVLKALKKIEYEEYCKCGSEYEEISEALNNIETFDDIERFCDLISLKSLTKVNCERQKAICITIQLIIDYIKDGCHSSLYFKFGERIEKIIKENENA